MSLASVLTEGDHVGTLQNLFVETLDQLARELSGRPALPLPHQVNLLAIQEFYGRSSPCRFLWRQQLHQARPLPIGKLVFHGSFGSKIRTHGLCPNSLICHWFEEADVGRCKWFR
jgi:hypothetical protein